jgi:hypothetical protein
MDEETARIVLERFHYLGSHRLQSQHHGTFAEDGELSRLAAVFSVSPLDVRTIANALPDGVTGAEVVVLSRVFAFDWAPSNTLSFAMGKLIRGLRRRPDPPKLVVTYVNPNVGFSGASYRASNWMLWAREAGTRYAYLDRDYITDRALLRRFGTTDPNKLAASLRKRLVFSRMKLSPLDLYAYPIDRNLRDKLCVHAENELPRPTE